MNNLNKTIEKLRRELEEQEKKLLEELEESKRQNAELHLNDSHEISDSAVSKDLYFPKLKKETMLGHKAYKIEMELEKKRKAYDMAISKLKLPVSSPKLPDSDKEIQEEFEKFKKLVSSYELSIKPSFTYYKPSPYYNEGLCLVDCETVDCETVVKSIETLLFQEQTWIFDEQYLIQAMILLAKKKASSDYIILIGVFLDSYRLKSESKPNEEKSGKFISIIMRQKENVAFFEECGKLLLISAIYFAQYELAKFLIAICGIHPNFDLGDREIFCTPLKTLILHSSGLNDRIEMLEFLMSYGLDLNQSDSGGTLLTLFIDTYIKSNHILFIKHLLEKGANPLLCNKMVKEINHGHNLFPLAAAQHCFGNESELVQVYLEYGAGLIKASKCSLYSNESNKLKFCKSGKFLEKKEYKKEDVLVFKSYIGAYITTLSDLSAELETIYNAPYEDQIRISRVCQFVLTSDPDDLVPGVLELFKKYAEKKRLPLVLAYETLKTMLILNDNLKRNILEYIKADSNIIKASMT